MQHTQSGEAHPMVNIPADKHFTGGNGATRSYYMINVSARKIKEGTESLNTLSKYVN